MSVVILGIESSCDDTSAAVIADGVLLSNVTASQAIHEMYGGVVPELASRPPAEHHSRGRCRIEKSRRRAHRHKRGGVYARRG